MRLSVDAYSIGLVLLVVLVGVWGHVFSDEINQKLDRLEELVLSEGLAYTTQYKQLETRVATLEQSRRSPCHPTTRPWWMRWWRHGRRGRALMMH